MAREQPDEKRFARLQSMIGDFFSRRSSLQAADLDDLGQDVAVALLSAGGRHTADPTSYLNGAIYPDALAIQIARHELYRRARRHSITTVELDEECSSTESPDSERESAAACATIVEAARERLIRNKHLDDGHALVALLALSRDLSIQETADLCGRSKSAIGRAMVLGTPRLRAVIAEIVRELPPDEQPHFIVRSLGAGERDLNVERSE